MVFRGGFLNVLVYKLEHAHTWSSGRQLRTQVLTVASPLLLSALRATSVQACHDEVLKKL